MALVASEVCSFDDAHNGGGNEADAMKIFLLYCHDVDLICCYCLFQYHCPILI